MTGSRNETVSAARDASAIRRFRDRSEAGRILARELTEYAGRDDVVVLALPRGGVPVGYELAKQLGAPLDVFVVRKVGVPGYEELAMGAVATGGVLDLDEKTAILVDDGLATGASMHAAALAVRRHKPGRVVVAVPVAAAETCNEFRGDVDEVVCARTPAPFYAVGLWYEDFSQTTDEEVRELLARAAAPG